MVKAALYINRAGWKQHQQTVLHELSNDEPYEIHMTTFNPYCQCTFQGPYSQQQHEHQGRKINPKLYSYCSHQQ